MLNKNLTLALASTLICFAAPTAHASEAPSQSIQCDPPVLHVQEGYTQFLVGCRGANPTALAPRITFSGELATQGTPPYVTQTDYRIDVTSMHRRALDQDPRRDQVLTGKLTAVTTSVAVLPSQFAAQSQWDAASSALSIQEQPGKWHVFVLHTDDAGEVGIVDSGYASNPVQNGQASSTVVLDKRYSRFAAKGDEAPAISVQLGLRQGKLEVLIGDTRVEAMPQVQNALLQLDKNPKDLSRAWKLAAIAKFLGLEEEMRYAEQRLAAHNPHLLEDFQSDLTRVLPFSLDVAASRVASIEKTSGVGMFQFAGSCD